MLYEAGRTNKDDMFVIMKAKVGMMVTGRPLIYMGPACKNELMIMLIQYKFSDS
jgi:hypothetical protein